MNKKRIVFTLLLVVGFTLSASNCVKIDTVGFSGSHMTPSVARDGMDHSAGLATNCQITVENLSEQNPDAYVNCRVTQEELEVEYDPNPPPPPEPQYGLFWSTSWDVTEVTIIGNGSRQYHFTMRHGDKRVLDLMPGNYVVRLRAGTRRIDVAFNVDNNHNDNRIDGANYDFHFEVTRI